MTDQPHEPDVTILHQNEPENNLVSFPVPTEAEAAAARLQAAKEKEAYDSIMRNSKSADEHKEDLTKFFHNISHMEKRIPALIDFGFKISHAVAQWAEEQRVNSNQVYLGEIFWTPQGDIAFDIKYDPMDLTPKEKPEYLKQGWRRMPQLAEHFPAVFELIMTVGTHLSMAIQNRQAVGKDLGFANLHHFTNVLTKRPAWGFRIFNGRRLLKSKPMGF